MSGLDIVKKLRAQLDANGYKDVEMKLIGDVPWSRGSSADTDITHAHQAAAAPTMKHKAVRRLKRAA